MKKFMKKDEGFIQYALCIMLISICALIMLYTLRMRIVQEQKAFIEDGLTSSTLASAVVDLNEFGTYEYIRSGSNNNWDEEEQKLYDLFVENLKINLNLNDAMYPTATNGIITSKVSVVNFWIYNKELDAVAGSIIKDYNGNWVQQHYEKDNYIVFKYIAQTDSNGVVTGSSTTTTEKMPSGTIYTPLDNNIIAIDGANNSNLDGAGKGQVEVEGMTIYATIQFSINPFGYNSRDTYNDGLFGIGSLVGDTVITKSVVVSVDTTKE